jgi:hypothetical protein
MKTQFISVINYLKMISEGIERIQAGSDNIKVLDYNEITPYLLKMTGTSFKIPTIIPW